MKYALLVGDGMGDLPIAELGGRTPLEAAATPAMDDLARRGVLYTVATVPPGMLPGSDVANLSLLGYQPRELYSGRAPLEAASMGIALAGNQLAFRCNLVTVRHEPGGEVRMLDYSAGHISSAEAHQLIAALADELSSAHVAFHPGVSYRHLLVTDGDAAGLATVPPHDHTGQLVTAHYDRYLRHPLFGPLLAAAERVLAEHPVNRARVARDLPPANSIWLWGEGRPPSMVPLPEQFGISGALISAVDLLKGIGVCAGLQVVNVPGATGYLDTNYEGKAAAALAALEERDFVFVHVEAPDEASHQGLLPEKMRAIEDFDARIVGPIVAGLRARGGDFRVMVAMDHYTPLAIRTHDPRPVPVLLFDSRWTEIHGQLAYSERHAALYGSFLASGREMFTLFLERDR
ncbi:MAG: cofactor-independent phosphoglycerate mutase [Thermodesulfobacteriota bacterium]